MTSYLKAKLVGTVSKAVGDALSPNLETVMAQFLQIRWIFSPVFHN